METRLGLSFYLNFSSLGALESKPKKVEDIFQNNQQATVSDVIGINHKGQTDLIFNGLSFKGL